MTASRYYLTLPRYAPPYEHNLRYLGREEYGQINELLFANRHTYQLSTPEEPGDLSWFIVHDHSDTLLPNMQGSDAIMTERTVYQRPNIVQLLRPGPKTINASITLRANDKCEWNEIRTKMLPYLFSPDLATVADFCSPIAIGSPNLQPDLWFFTYETNFNDRRMRYSIPIFAFWLSNDAANSTSAFTLDTTLTMWSNDSVWYGDTNQFDLSGETNSDYITGPDEILNPQSLLRISDPIMFPTQNDVYVHRGTVRSDWDIEFTVQNSTIGTTQMEILSIVVTDVTYAQPAAYAGARWTRLRHIDWPTGGWVVPAGKTINIRTLPKRFVYDEGLGLPAGILDSQVDMAANGLGGVWERMKFIPGGRYLIFIETVENHPINNLAGNVAKFNITERFGGV